jgi:thiol:disulfide interchange protein DsbD
MNNAFMKYLLFAFIVFSSCSNSGDKEKVNDNNSKNKKEVEKKNNEFPIDNITEAIKFSKEKRKPILLIFTAWAASDRTVEKKLLEDKSIKDYLHKNYIVAFLKIDDKTPLPKSEQKEEVFYSENYKPVTVGNRNLFYQLDKFNANTQPYMAVIDEKENQILNPIGYIKNKNEILNFLEKGVEEYKK